MNKLQYASRLLLAGCVVLLVSSAVIAQRGGGRGGDRGGERGGGRSNGYSFHDRDGGNRNYSSAGSGYRGYNGGYNNYRPIYRPNYSYGYGYGQRYNYYPSYHYRPIYTSPYAYSHFGPAFGFRLSILPFGYYPFYIGSNPYYYYQGVYYRPYDDGGYEVIAPPLGATVKHLPSGAKATVINGQKYYELGGTFYQEQLDAKNKVRYVVVGTDGVINTVDQDQQQQDAPDAAPNVAPNQPPAQGSTISQLPANSKVVVINQQKLYLAPSGIYYKEVIDANNNVTYEVAGGSDNSTGTYQ